MVSEQLVMKRNRKPSGIGMDFLFGPFLVDSVAENVSVRIMSPVTQAIPLDHRDVKELLLKLRPDPEFFKQAL